MKNQNRLKRIGVFDAIFAAEHTAKITNQRKEIARLTDALADQDATIANLTAANMVLMERVEAARVRDAEAREVITVMHRALVITDKMSARRLSDHECMDIGVAKDCGTMWLAGKVGA